MKKVLLLSSTPVAGGNSEILCQEFARGAQDAGCQVELVSLREKDIGFCKGCEACVRTGKGCMQQDDMAQLLAKVHAADVLVLATPIYFMSVSAQLKVFMDRFIAGELYMRQSGGKKAYFITVSAAPISPEHAENHEAANGTFRGFLRCLRQVEEGGILNAGAAMPRGPSGSSQCGWKKPMKWENRCNLQGTGGGYL